MGCHGNNKENQGTHKHSPLKHILHMILCCGLPILIFISLPFISRVNPNVSRILAFVAPFICPLMMIGMIPMMLSGGKNKSYCETKENTSNVQLELNEPTE